MTGVDANPAMQSYCRAAADVAGVPQASLNLVVGDVAALPFPDASFDAVVCTLVLFRAEIAAAPATTCPSTDCTAASDSWGLTCPWSSVEWRDSRARYVQPFSWLPHDSLPAAQLALKDVILA